ncbi:MAG: hypothetical protein QG597_4162 [Actinomycetota bacterium]|nr:hypothetical protein [Actinomycetota bacterium]
MTTALAALSGAAITAGLLMIAIGLQRPLPDLRSALAHLDGRIPSPTSPTPPTGHDPDTGAVDRWTASLARRLARTHPGTIGATMERTLRLGRLTADLRLLSEPVEVLLVRKAVCLLLGLLLAPAATAILALAEIRLGWTTPVGLALLTGGAAFIAPDLDIRARATTSRDQLRRATCLYIDLIALERAADAGPTQALDRAAALRQAPAFARFRDTLTRARLDGHPPWQGLHALAESTGVTELDDLADIMATSGRQGTAVYASLRARAASLRTALAAQDAAEANAASERMVVPAALLGLIFMALIAYPALARIVAGS